MSVKVYPIGAPLATPLPAAPRPPVPAFDGTDGAA